MSAARDLRPSRACREVRPGDDLAGMIADAAPDLAATATCVVVTQKVVSKAEGRLVPIDPDDPRQQGRSSSASRCGSCAAGATSSSARPRTASCAPTPASTCRTSSDGWAALLPDDSDRSARRIRDGSGPAPASTSPSSCRDTFGRPWRRGLTDVAIGCAGIAAVVDLRGTADALGRELQVTEVASSTSSPAPPSW